jgi:hypothetical protein
MSLRLEKKHLLTAFVLLVAVISMLAGLRELLVPYVSVRQAMQARGRVQVLGAVDRSVPVRHSTGWVWFALCDDDGTCMPVTVSEPLPPLFDRAEKNCTDGSYDQAAALCSFRGPFEIAVKIQHRTFTGINRPAGSMAQFLISAGRTITVYGGPEHVLRSITCISPGNARQQ